MTRLSRGLLLLRWGRLADAEVDLRAAVNLPGGGYGARVALARVAIARKDPKTARRLLDEAIALKPKRTTAYGDRYRLRLAQGDKDAMEDWRRGLTLTSKFNRTDLVVRLGGDPFLLAERTGEAGFGEFAKALHGSVNERLLERSDAWLRRSLAFDPWGLSTAARMASVVYLLGRVSKADAAYQRAREVDPSLVAH